MSARRDHTFCPASRQRDSVDRAWERRRVVSRMRVRCVSRSDWLGGGVGVRLGFVTVLEMVGALGSWELGGWAYPELALEWKGGCFPYRPDSKEGDARGESSVVMVKMPSNFRSGRGAVMEAEMRVRTLWMEKVSEY